MPVEPALYSPSESAPDAADWKGTARYEVLRCIGKGGMGVVYEAFDRERQQRVALKTLLNSSPAALYLFKQEFRTLADVHHRNLVQLYELVVGERDRVFFTMELVLGTDFLTHVQKGGDAVSDEGAETTKNELTRREVWHPESTDGGPPLEPAREAPVRRQSSVVLERLRPALFQLVEGIQALHAAGKLHRDIKPSNVRVTPDGRVVLLDFGVAMELPRVADQNLHEGGEMVGTVRYMAPEQAVSEEPTPSSDWYSVGVMLYEALVGSPPFVGSSFDVLKMKSMLDPRTPSECADGVPDDLDALARALLEREPERRPTGAEILRQLGIRPSLHPAPPPPQATEGPPTIVGREEELRALRDAFELTRRGRTITVLFGGPSGIGKATVVQHFLDALVENGEAVVLRGRAHERESVPYKGVDSVVDALSRHLMRLSDREDSLTLPTDVWALARLFPVLRRVPSIANMEEQVASDPHRMRRRAFFALRELLTSLARRQPLVIFVDGVQWGDVDSAALILDLVRPPDTPPLLLVMTYRPEELQTSPFLLQIHARWPALAELRNLIIGPLDEGQSRRLALALLGSDDGRAQVTAEAIAIESQGTPFLVNELARSVTGPHRVSRSEDTSPGIATVTLEQMVKARLARLPERELRLLRVVAVAGRPLSVSVAADAAGVHDAVDDAVGLVRARRFVRTGIRDGVETVEMIHDRIREMIVAKLSPAAIRKHHRELARVLEAAPDADAEAIATHLIGAGETARAAHYAELAAEKAASQLAFDRAVSLYQLTISTLPSSSPEVHRVRLRLAAVLEWAGRGAESAKAYLEVAETAPPAERVDLERTAAEHLLTSGRIDEGAVVLHRVLASLRMKAPRSSASALFWLLVYRVLLLAVGLRFKERDPAQVSREDRMRVDALYSLSLGFVLVDAVLGACMQSRHLLHALRAGDRFQVMRAVSLEASNLAGAGGVEGRRARALRAIGQRLAERSADPEEQLFVDGTYGIGLFLRGQFKEARDKLEQVAQGHRRQKRAGWQANVFLFALDSLLVLGALREASSLHDRLLTDAELSGDRYTIVSLRLSGSVVLALAGDEPELARRHIREAMSLWSQSGYLVQHWQAMHYEAEIELYVGDPVRAYDRIVRDEIALKRSFILHAQLVRGLTWFLKGRCAVASAAALPAEASSRLAEAHRLAGRLERESAPWGPVFGSIVAAAVAIANGDRSIAISLLRAAIAAADRANMVLHAAAARYQLGLLIGGDAGRVLVQQGDEEMASRGVRVPAKMAARLVPGRWNEH